MENQECCADEPLQVQTVVEEKTLEEQELEFLLDKESKSQQRMEICKGCEHLTGKLNKCDLCNCFMNIKTRIFFAKCPVDKW
jgi:hypothetical protein